SLTVSEPPAFGVARGNPAVEEFIARFEEIVATNPSPRDYLAQFAPLVGSTLPTPETLPPPLEQGAQAALAERPPFEAEIPFEERLGADRAVVSGAGHSLPRAPGYYDTLVGFIERAS